MALHHTYLRNRAQKQAKCPVSTDHGSDKFTQTPIKLMSDKVYATLDV